MISIYENIENVSDQLVSSFLDICDGKNTDSNWKVIREKNGICIQKSTNQKDVSIIKSIVDFPNCDIITVYNILSNLAHFKRMNSHFVSYKNVYIHGKYLFI